MRGFRGEGRALSAAMATSAAYGAWLAGDVTVNGFSHAAPSLVPLGAGAALIVGLVRGRVRSTRERAAGRDELRAMATELAEARSHRDSVIRGLSGEIRHSVGIVEAAARSMQQTAQSEESQRAAEQAGRSAARLARMIDDIFAATETSVPQASSKRLVEIPAALNEAAAASPAPARIQVETPGALVAVGDPDAVSGIVKHLLDNAIKFTTGAVYVKATERDRSIEISVTDQGPGVAPTAGQKIFDRFFTTPVSGVDGGAGTGLYLAGRMARSMSGTLTLDATHAPGARFVLSIPGISSQRIAPTPRARWSDPAAVVPQAAAGLPFAFGG